MHGRNSKHFEQDTTLDGNSTVFRCRQLVIRYSSLSTIEIILSNYGPNS
jgi:hypothetical protein